MSRLDIPITGKVLWYTGDLRLWVDLDLSLKNGSGTWQPETFRVDTGTQITTFPAYEAKRLGLPMPAQANRGATHVQTGLEVRSGVLRFRIDGMDPTEYVLACLFLSDPDAPPDPARPAPGPGSCCNLFSSWIGSASRSTRTPRPDCSTANWLWKRNE